MNLSASNVVAISGPAATASITFSASRKALSHRARYAEDREGEDDEEIKATSNSTTGTMMRQTSNTSDRLPSRTATRGDQEDLVTRSPVVVDGTNAKEEEPDIAPPAASAEGSMEITFVDDDITRQPDAPGIEEILMDNSDMASLCYQVQRLDTQEEEEKETEGDSGYDENNPDHGSCRSSSIITSTKSANRSRSSGVS